MGCDIHLIVQVYDGTKWITRDDDGLDYSERNYQAFSILAGVRKDLTPISPEKGYPKDIVLDSRRHPDVDYEGYEGTVDGHWLGEHSISWHTLLDLVNFDWQQEHTSKGYIAASDYTEWAKTRQRPSTYCGWSSGTLYTEEEFLATDGSYEGKGGGCKQLVQVTWKTTYAECAGYFYNTFYQNLLNLAAEEGILYRNIRIVFGFDS